SPRSISCSPSPSSPVSPPNLRCSAVPAGQLPFASLAKVDALYGLSAVLLVAVGLYRALHLDKGWEYYSHSVPFIIKLSLFGVIALLSVYPTVQFIRARRGGRGMA